MEDNLRTTQALAELLIKNKHPLGFSPMIRLKPSRKIKNYVWLKPFGNPNCPLAEALPFIHKSKRSQQK